MLSIFCSQNDKGDVSVNKHKNKGHSVLPGPRKGVSVKISIPVEVLV